jgi:putative endonuclease
VKIKKTTKQIGDAGEDLAADFLIKKGYIIIDRNFRTRYGEVDIIAKDKDCLVFIEVKAKASDCFGSPGEMINPKKQQKLKNMALAYTSENNITTPWRIDAVLMEGKEIEHLISIDVA